MLVVLSKACMCHKPPKIKVKFHATYIAYNNLSDNLYKYVC